MDGDILVDKKRKHPFSSVFFKSESQFKFILFAENEGIGQQAINSHQCVEAEMCKAEHTILRRHKRLNAPDNVRRDKASVCVKVYSFRYTGIKQGNTRCCYRTIRSYCWIEVQLSQFHN